MPRLFANATYNFLRWRWHALALSAAVILIGLALTIARGGLPLGVDFSGGTIIVLKFEEPVTEEVVRRALDPMPGDKVVQQYGARELNEILVRLPLAEVEEEGIGIEEGAQAVVTTVQQADLGEFEVIATEIVGPVIGAELQRKGIYATVAALLGIFVYITFRFRFTFAIGAIAAVFHDILVVLTFLTLFGYELSLNVVAAILTIAGYSVNDTIVIYDRVRENLRMMRRDSLEQVVNTSVNHTLGRTVITSGTTFGAVLALFILGGEVLRGFAFTMLVGVAAGTYSTVFIAAAIAVILGQRRAAARARTAAPQARVADVAKKPVRNARVS
jgi:preprotein translocase subunit SecF